jgi:hypothetical protein
MAGKQPEKSPTSMGTGVTEQAKDTLSRATDKVKEAASQAAATASRKASEASSYIGHKAEDATEAVGQGARSFAGTIREKGPHEGMLGSATATMADTLDSCGRELQEHGLTGIADDLTNTIRRHPVPAVLIGIGLGFLLAQTMSSSRS